MFDVGLPTPFKYIQIMFKKTYQDCLFRSNILGCLKYVIKSSPINIICYVPPPICSLVLSDSAVGGVAQGRL